jgi:hypothetical protein
MLLAANASGADSVSPPQPRRYAVSAGAAGTVPERNDLVYNA